MSGISPLSSVHHRIGQGGLFAAACRWALLLYLLLPSATAGANPAKVSLASRLEAASLEILVDGHLAGSGWFVASQGLAITAAHVVRGGRLIEVRSPGGGRLRAKRIRVDTGHDLALLRVERRGGLFPTLELALAPPTSGTPLVLFGTALYRHGLLFPGSVAGDRLTFEWNVQNRCYTEAQPVAAQAPRGLSGGPWTNLAGEVVGVQSSVMSGTGGMSGIAFMSPVTAVQELLDGQATAATLGGIYAESWEPSRRSAESGAAGSTGIRVLEVLGAGPLAEAGVEPGELIVTLDGRPLELRDELLGRVRGKAPGEPVTLGVVNSHGERRQVVVTLADCNRR
ncbi:hypothetical protein JCM30471_01500 [Desulfuromonas carbonis]|uniref:S1C family serine protease n=1 Tax=Desulfuromonas sp. DDH964 TaxID=1823759 RepID=UPI00078E2F89|nr:S1C family serine protease [Desulfuromonas sp. DDH964]AMV71791.1 periplasmic trypsin-like serine protease DegP [Desulfuromonas sp. DDH964]